VLEVATICVQTGLNPARHILEIPCQYVRCHCVNFFGDVCFQGVYGSWFVSVNSPFQISPSGISRRRQIGRARWPKSLRNDAVADTDRCSASQQLGALRTHSSSFFTKRTYSSSKFFAVSSLVLKLLKKCRFR